MWDSPGGNAFPQYTTAWCSHPPSSPPWLSGSGNFRGSLACSSSSSSRGSGEPSLKVLDWMVLYSPIPLPMPPPPRSPAAGPPSPTSSHRQHPAAHEDRVHFKQTISPLKSAAHAFRVHSNTLNPIPSYRQQLTHLQQLMQPGCHKARRCHASVPVAHHE